MLALHTVVPGDVDLAPDVLVSAARQHLMSADADRLQLMEVQLLLADYQELAGQHYCHQAAKRWVTQQQLTKRWVVW